MASPASVGPLAYPVPPAPLPPPPPPPPPPTPEPSPGRLVTSFSPPEVETPNQFIKVQYSNDSTSDFASRVIRIGPFRRNLLMTRHPAHVADYKEFEWLLKHGSSEIWYEKPTKANLRSIRTLEAPDELLPLLNARPVSLETPKVWASMAMTTATNDGIFECTAGHVIDDGYAGTCHECTDATSEALENTPLVYCLVFSTYQASDPFIHGAHFNGRPIYKLVKCGSREAAVAEAFYAAGVNDWSLAFSCVTKLGEDFEERPGTAKKVNELWMLAEEEDDVKTIKVFY
ncbi:uncharacterized protein ALTATR162_LOCUS12123 [Alternaria atra]|uniref:Uncharacterized protein n=1 Tax=Alternaria atra TaxID=119953 RepID=A0A8J2N5S4_9PLEO|nr:uncharacterized protein ALTATR162_LOCUS12123 [Alternaria atra]CAG5190075.1 unnamed protein product [Alternaria atra]